MEKIFKYSTVGLILCLVITFSYSLIIKSQRDQVKNQLNSSEHEIAQLKASNKALDQVIQTLEQQNQQNRQYINELEEKRLATQEQTNQQIQQFKRQQHENSTINSWANEPIPSGLY